MVSQESIQSTARQIAEKFKPDKIILFGSYAYGTPTEDSDVDMLMVMDTPLREREQAHRILDSVAFENRYAQLSLLVRTPEKLKWWIDNNECFHKEIIAQGTTLYECDHA